MSGKEIFDRYQLAALAKGLGSQEFQYGNTLYQALHIEGEETLFRLLELAESKGKRIALSGPPFPNEANGGRERAILI